MTSLRQDIQVRPSSTFLDNLGAGATLETGSANLEDDANGLRSQVNRIIDATLGGNWYDAIPVVNSKTRGLLQLNTDLDDMEEKKILCNANILTDVTVPAAQNWKILSVAGSETPSQVAAVALTQNGAVVAQSALSGAGFDVHELIEIAGSDAINPKNLVQVRDATTGQPLQSSGRDVFALLQYESTGVDGAAFNDTSAGNRAKVSFVRLNAALDDIEACPVADIANEVVNFNYLFRINLDALPEDCAMASRSFTDQSASVDVTRQNAYDNQGATAVDLTTNALLDLESAGIAWRIRDDAEANLLSVIEGSAGGTSEIEFGSDVDTFDNDAAVNNFASGATVNSGGTRPVAVGVTDGVVASTAGDLEVEAAAELRFDDGNRSGSTWSVDLKLTETTTEWDDLETAFGEVSLAAMLLAANAANTTRKVEATVTAAVAANNDISGPANDNNIDLNLGDLSGGTFADDYDFAFNGGMVPHSGVGGANTPVVSAGTSLANGQIRFNFQVRATPANNPDTITLWARA